MNQFFLEINTCTIAPWQLILGLLLPFLLGYLFKRFLDEQYVKGFKSLTAENSSLKDEVSKSLSYKSSLSVAEKEQKNLKAGLLEIEKRNTSLLSQLDTSAAKLKPYLGIDVAGLQSRISELESKNNKLNADIQELSGTKSSLEDAAAGLNMLKSNLTAIKDENNRLKMDLRAAIDAKEKTVASNESMSKLKEEIRDMSGKIGGHSVESDRLKKEAEEAKASLGGAKAEGEVTKAALESIKKEQVVLSQQLSAANGELNALRSKATGGETEINELKNKLTAATNDLTGARSKMNELEMKAGSLTSEVQSVQNKLSASDNEKSNLQKALDDCNKSKSVIDGLNSEIAFLKQRISGLDQENSTLKIAAIPAPVPAAKDDLKLVEGIGPKIEEIFKKAGINSFRQLADSSFDRLKEILHAEGPRYQIHDPYTWPRQASLLADNKLKELEEYQDYLIAGVDPERISIAKGEAEPAKKDDLIKIEGIGPKIQELCYTAGIYTFKQMSATPVEKLKSILNDAGPRYQMHDPSTWPEQSGLAANGKWEELKLLQDNLKGGKTS